VSLTHTWGLLSVRTEAVGGGDLTQELLRMHLQSRRAMLLIRACVHCACGDCIQWSHAEPTAYR